MANPFLSHSGASRSDEPGTQGNRRDVGPGFRLSLRSAGKTRSVLLKVVH